MKGFLSLVAAFTVVYVLAPWVAWTILNASAEHPERYTGIALLAMCVAYAALRGVFRERLPRV